MVPTVRMMSPLSPTIASASALWVTSGVTLLDASSRAIRVPAPPKIRSLPSGRWSGLVRLKKSELPPTRSSWPRPPKMTSLPPLPST